MRRSIGGRLSASRMRTYSPFVCFRALFRAPALNPFLPSLPTTRTSSPLERWLRASASVRRVASSELSSRTRTSRRDLGHSSSETDLRSRGKITPSLNIGSWTVTKGYVASRVGVSTARYLLEPYKRIKQR